MCIRDRTQTLRGFDSSPRESSLWHDAVMNEERTVWSSLNTIHGVVYFHPEAAKSYKELGLRGYWSGYFASRAAALGTPRARVVTALFHGFAPSKVCLLYTSPS